MLFDVLEPVDERFAWGDLVAAREAARLLKQGVAIGDVLEASVALRRRGSNLAEARLTEGPTGELAAPGRRPARRALGPAHHVQRTRPAEAAQHRRSSRRGRGGRSRGRPRHGREPLHHGDARRHRRSRAALQPRQRLPGAGPRPRGQGGVADRGGARSAPSPRPGTTSRWRRRTRSRPTSPSPSTGAR